MLVKHKNSGMLKYGIYKLENINWVGEKSE